MLVGKDGQNLNPSLNSTKCLAQNCNTRGTKEWKLLLSKLEYHIWRPDTYWMTDWLIDWFYSPRPLTSGCCLNGLPYHSCASSSLLRSKTPCYPYAPPKVVITRLCPGSFSIIPSFKICLHCISFPPEELCVLPCAKPFRIYRKRGKGKEKKLTGICFLEEQFSSAFL